MIKVKQHKRKGRLVRSHSRKKDSSIVLRGRATKKEVQEKIEAARKKEKLSRKDIVGYNADQEPRKHRGKNPGKRGVPKSAPKSAFGRAGKRVR